MEKGEENWNWDSDLRDVEQSLSTLMHNYSSVEAEVEISEQVVKFLLFFQTHDLIICLMKYINTV